MPTPPAAIYPVFINPNGRKNLLTQGGLGEFELVVQCLVFDDGAVEGVSFTNALRMSPI